MKIIDLPNPDRVKRIPDQTEVIFSAGGFKEQGVSIKKVEMRLYIERTDKEFGPYSLITSLVETDIGSIEMLYDQGFRGEDSLNRAINFLVSNLGVSGLILRSVIALKNYQKEK